MGEPGWLTQLFRMHEFEVVQCCRTFPNPYLTEGYWPTLELHKSSWWFVASEPSSDSV